MSECSRWPPPRREKRFFLALPASILSVEKSLLSKTLKTGFIARTLSIFRIDKAIVYKDSKATTRDYRVLRIILEYLSTPPHLRKKLFPLLPELRYVGLLPPIQAPSHIAPEEPVPGMIIDGLVEKCEGDSCQVYLGKMGYGILRKRVRPGKVITVEILRVEEGVIRLRRVKPSFYWRYRVEAYPSLKHVIEKYSGKMTIVGTSRLGICDRDTIRRSLYGRDLLVVFGGPEGHVWDELDRDRFDLIINSVPFQGTRTIRTEEAVLLTIKYLDDILES